MHKKIYKEDKGLNFGKWNDNISKLIYYDSIKEILLKIDTSGKVADYGGANGILKQFIPDIITIDIDPTKKPDILENILCHRGNYDLIIIRFVLHYLSDYEVLKLFDNIEKHHNGKILVVQFTNEDLKSKYRNSINELKYFRTKNQLQNLLPNFKNIYSIKYKCTKEFYKNRLGIDNAIKHKEQINAYLI